MIKILQQALAKHPFHPITVVMTNGTSLTVDHADFAVVLVRWGFLYVELPTESLIGFRNIKEVRLGDLVVEDRGEDNRN